MYTTRLSCLCGGSRVPAGEEGEPKDVTHLSATKTNITAREQTRIIFKNCGVCVCMVLIPETMEGDGAQGRPSSQDIAAILSRNFQPDLFIIACCVPPHVHARARHTAVYFFTTPAGRVEAHAGPKSPRFFVGYKTVAIFQAPSRQGKKTEDKN